MKPIFRVLMIIAALCACHPAWAENPPRSPLAPDAFFLKSGLANGAAAFSVGAGWDQSDWLWSPLADHFSLAVEVEVGHWQTFRLRHDQAEFTQFGLTPMLRLPLATSAAREWFVEGGVGFHFIVPLYRNQEKRFSTSFNFQDLIGLGLRFGAERRQEVVLYISHFSNAAINEPNPGENFLQLRYLRHLD